MLCREGEQFAIAPEGGVLRALATLQRLPSGSLPGQHCALASRTAPEASYRNAAITSSPISIAGFELPVALGCGAAHDGVVAAALHDLGQTAPGRQLLHLGLQSPVGCLPAWPGRCWQ